MKSYIYYISLLFLACMGMTSCTEHEIEEIDDAQYLELTLSCVNLSSTRADDVPSTMGGEDDFNENLIRTLHYFLYPSGVADGNAVNAVLAGKFNVAEGTKKNAVIRIPMDEPTLNNVVFPRPHNDCNVYLIANLPADVSKNIDLDPEGGYSGTSIDELKALAINSFKNADVRSTYETQDFVMDGEAKATIVSRSKTIAARGTILLDRLAAKLTTRISVTESFTDTDGMVWTPQTGSMEIHLDNAVSNTTLGGTFGNSHFDYAQRRWIGTRTETVGGQTKTQYVFYPFYSYPCQWEYLDEDALVMYIKLPWLGRSSDGNTTRTETCYYKVYPNTMQLDRNSWYNMDLHIGVLGSFSETEEPVVIENYEYKVIDWKNGFDKWDAGLNINTDLLSAHYLVVEQNHYVVNNKNTFEIPFITSHECIIKDYDNNTDGNAANDFKVTKKIFIRDGEPVNDDQDITDEARKGNWITIEGNKIVLKHPLNNNFESSTDYDYTPYTFTFTICHKDNQNKFQEKITIIQKPAISVAAELNTKYVQGGSSNNGYVFVNANSVPNYGSTNNSYNYGGLGNLQTSGNNSNPYMYIIEVSVLPKGSEYILGDPRVKFTWSQSDINEFAQAPALNGTSPRKLTNYYGTINKSSVENMLAPKFRVASAHGRVASSFQDYNGIVKRSATYQEDGYPAGRWRLPTRAEIKFVAKLYADKKIPPLFHSESGFTVDYWYSTGTITPKSDGTLSYNDEPTSSTTGAVRSVYDEWYWEQLTPSRLTDYKVFTWGDEIN